MSGVSERRIIKGIRTHLAQISSDWAFASDDRGMLLDAVEKTAGGTSRIVLARFERIATPDEVEFIVRSPEYIGFLLGFADRALAYADRLKMNDAATATAQPERGQGEPANYAAEAAMKCQEPAFKRFLMEQHGLESPATDDRVAQRLRSVLGVTSRRELNDNNQATERWKALRSEFEAWRRAG